MEDDQIKKLQARVSKSFDLADRIIPLIEESWGCLVLLDGLVFGEAITRAESTISSIDHEEPNHFKQAGHYAFWIRKLKPLSVADTDAYQNAFDYFREKGLIQGEMAVIMRHVPKVRGSYISEIFAIIVAIGMVRRYGVELDLNKDRINDLAVNLRYHSFSPSSFSAILEALAVP